MRKTMINGSIILLIIGFFSIRSFAMMPVIDAGAITQIVNELRQLKNQYTLLNQTYQNAQSQLDKAKEIASDAEGHYGFGNQLNSGNDLTNREWSPNNWDNALQGLSGGNPARYQQLFTQYKQDHPTLSQSDYEKGASKEKAKVYQQQVNTNRAVSVNATYAFNDIKQHLQAVHQISGQIEQAKNTKAAVDLNSRLLTEVAYIQIQELKMQTLLNEQLAQRGGDRISDETQNAKFNTLPDQ